MSREKQIEELTNELIKTNGYGTLSAVAEALYHANCRRVTKCKDCVHYLPYPKPVEDFDGMCTACRGETDEDEFCSRGAKMGGGAE